MFNDLKLKALLLRTSAKVYEEEYKSVFPDNAYQQFKS